MSKPENQVTERMGEAAQGQHKARPKVRPEPAEALADVALIDGPTCAAGGGMSLSWWHNQVQLGNAPQAVIREPRCTRWRLSDVRAYWRERAEQGEKDAQAAGNLLRARATTASHKARAMRSAVAAQPTASV